MSVRGVTIQFDVPRKVRFDGAALLALEEITGMTVLAVCRQFKGEDDESKSEAQQAEARAANFSFKLVVQITQAGLTEELPHITTLEMVKMMEENGKGDGSVQKILSYTEPVFQALSDAIGEGDAKNVKTDPEKKKSPDRKKATAV